MPVSPSGVSGISAFHFRTCRSLDELRIFRVGPATFTGRPPYDTNRQKDPKPRKLPARCRHAHSFESFLEFCLSTPAFSSIILFHMFVQAFDTLKIPEHRFGTRETLRKVICLSISQALFLLLYHFHMNMNIYETHDLTNYQLTVGSFLPAITFI